MVFVIIIPRTLKSIMEVTIFSLKVPQNGFVKEDQGILEFGSEKINQSIYAPCDGTVHWNVRIGDTVAVGAVVGTVDPEGLKAFGEVINDVVDKVSVVENALDPDSMNAEIIEIPIVNEGPPRAKNFVPLKQHNSKKNEFFKKNDAYR